MKDFLRQVQNSLKIVLIVVLYIPFASISILLMIIARALLEYIAVWFAEEEEFNEARYNSFIRRLIMLFFTDN